MSAIPTWAFPLILAVIAAVAGKVLTGRVRDDPGSFPGWILYAVAIGCVVISLALMWLDNRS